MLDRIVMDWLRFVRNFFSKVEVLWSLLRFRKLIIGVELYIFGDVSGFGILVVGYVVII